MTETLFRILSKFVGKLHKILVFPLRKLCVLCGLCVEIAATASDTASFVKLAGHYCY